MSGTGFIGTASTQAKRSRNDANSGRSSGSCAPSYEAPRILQPFDIREAVTLDEAAKIAGRSVKTLKRWASLDDIGRPVAGRWMVSRVLLAMHLDGDRQALRAYWAGDRSGPAVRPYFERAGLA